MGKPLNCNHEYLLLHDLFMDYYLEKCIKTIYPSGNGEANGTTVFSEKSLPFAFGNPILCHCRTDGDRFSCRKRG